MDSALKATLREILYASLSLDDGLSAIQNFAITNEKEGSSLYFDIARILEEIILRRPGLASAKVTELTVRLAFDEDIALCKMLTLLDARYNTIHEIAECELLPDIEAIPKLLDIHGELIQAMIDALELNLRPLLPFLTDAVLVTLDGISTRGHKATTEMVVHESHYLSTLLSEARIFDCAEAILNRLMSLTSEDDFSEIVFDVSLDEASVLTEIGLYNESRKILHDLRDNPKVINDPSKYAAVLLQLAVNETRDDNVSHETARAIADEAAQRIDMITDCDTSPKEGLALALLVVGSNILVNGWREAVPEGIERLQDALKIFEGIEDPDMSQTVLHVKCLTGLGFAYGLMRDYEHVSKSLRYFNQAITVLEKLRNTKEYETDLARVHNAIGWVCLSSESDEFWDTGIESFEKAIGMRNTLWTNGEISELEFLGSKVGLALSLIRSPDAHRGSIIDDMHSILSQYAPLFPTDRRAFIETAIAIYNLVWLSIRHSIEIPQRMMRLLDDIDKMLVEARALEDSVFVHGASLVVPYLTSSWDSLQKRASLLKENPQLAIIAHLAYALATAKRNIHASNMETVSTISDEFDDTVYSIDPLLAQYWKGQARLGLTIKHYYENKDYSALATGLYAASQEMRSIENISTDYLESAEFIRATALSLSKSLMKFAMVLAEHFGASIEFEGSEPDPVELETEQYDFLLTGDWLGLLKISDSYLDLVKDLEFSQAQPYLNAVFSNTARALRMMDTVSMIERRVFAHLGDMMNARYYLRK